MTTSAAPTVDYTNQPSPRGTMRLWPAVVILIAMWVGSRVPGWIAPVTMWQFMGLMWVPILALVALLIWWLVASRLPWSQRLLIPGAFIGIAVVVAALSHPSMRQGPVLPIFALPLALTAWVGALLVTPRLAWSTRRWVVIAAIALAWSYFTLIRLDGLTGDFGASTPFRWAGTSEQRFLANRTASAPRPTTAPAQLTLSAADWPGFRGPNRDSRATGQRIRTDWDKRPPKQIWRHAIGPGWSSFAVIGDRLFTQEQRGQVECTVCYDANTGNEFWVHEDRTRFEEPLAGPGPRATPTFYDGRLYTLGASGTLNCLDPATGSVIWSHDARGDSNAPLPMWGFSSSPLISHGIVSVITGGPSNKAVVAYDAATGKPAWSAGEGWSYASVHPARLGGVDELLLATVDGVTALDPERGTALWRHQWPIAANMNRVTQPLPVSDDSFLIGTGFGYGTRLVRLTHSGDQWQDAEVWTSRQMKPYYNDFVLHDGHLYGFDNALFACASLAENGKVLWRARGYGNGQALLLPDQSLLVVLTEQGEVALVRAAPDAHHELGKFQAINGKTWNHPVVSRGKLFVRNGEEAAAYDVAE